MVSISIKNLPVEYNRNEVIQLLFNDEEKKLVTAFSLIKVEKDNPKGSFSKATLSFEKDPLVKEEIENIIKKLDGLKLNEDNILKVLPYKPRHKNKRKYKNTKTRNSNGEETNKREGKALQKMSVSASELRKEPNSRNTMLFVRGLPFDCVDTVKIAKFFSVEENKIAIPRRRLRDIKTNEIFIDSGKNKGYAFIKFSDDVDIDAKIKEFNGREFEQRQILVSRLKNIQNEKR